jgi:hypothetical protein
MIDNIGSDFVNQMGQQICENKYVSFLEQRLDRFLNLSVDNEEVKEENPLTQGLTQHLRSLNLGEWDEVHRTLDALPKCLQSVIFYRTYKTMQDFFRYDQLSHIWMPTNNPEFGRQSYLKLEPLSSQFWMKKEERIALISDLITAIG